MGKGMSGVKYIIKTQFKRYVHLPLVEGYSDFIIMSIKIT